jgi:hypothetical protein
MAKSKINTRKKLHPDSPYINIGRDMFFILLSVLFAMILVRFGVIKNIIGMVEEGKIIGSFLAGVFFTSAFTIAPASIALAELSQTTSIWVVAFCGALGAVVGDMVLFLFIRDKFADDLSKALHAYHDKKLTRFFHRKFFHWLTPLIGAFIIASPLPDEMGITMLGVSKIKTGTLVAISFVMNFVGILLVAFVAHAL